MTQLLGLNITEERWLSFVDPKLLAKLKNISDYNDALQVWQCGVSHGDTTMLNRLPTFEPHEDGTSVAQLSFKHKELKFEISLYDRATITGSATYRSGFDKLEVTQEMLEDKKLFVTITLAYFSEHKHKTWTTWSYDNKELEREAYFKLSYWKPKARKFLSRLYDIFTQGDFDNLDVKAYESHMSE